VTLFLENFKKHKTNGSFRKQLKLKAVQQYSCKVKMSLFNSFFLRLRNKNNKEGSTSFHYVLKGSWKFWKVPEFSRRFKNSQKCSIKFIKRPSVCPPVCTLFFRYLSTNNLQSLDYKRRVSIYEEYSWVFRSKAQELWNWVQIRTLSN
jgi:hypothetical protein